MKLSVIIVNYNVKFFLAQCLDSVHLALKAINNDAEVFVVDNHSVDGSCFLIKEQFPWVKLIENTENVGFSKANNQAIKLSSGDFILLLNPDTVVKEDTFAKIIAFMKKTPDAGGLGVRMIDGKGNFLPESKRGLPTPQVAFFKIIGLSKIFKKSLFFNRYHLGYLNENEIHTVDILSGAFMLIRKTVLDKTGLLDETFFMYGEDVDLSYRITEAGYHNYYFPESTIIHYKGESTKKGSINYVRMFYAAMAIFANKHFKSQQSNLMSFFIHFAILFRASVALFRRFMFNFLLPAVDFIFFYAAFYLITLFWENIKYHGKDSYPAEFIWYVLPMYSLLFVFSLFYMDTYHKRPHWQDIFKGLGLGSLFILSLYALLSENLRYSRAIVMLAIVFAFLIFPLFRYVLGKMPVSLFKIGKPQKKRAVIIGNLDEYTRTKEMLQSSSLMYETFAWVVPSVSNSIAESSGLLTDLSEIIRIHKINEVIFCSKDISPNDIIEQMTTLSDFHVDFKIVGNAIIGSKTVYADEPAFEVSINSIAKSVNRRNKRLFDVLFSGLLFVLLPVEVIFLKNRKQFIQNLFEVISGNKTWVGFTRPTHAVLPKIKNSILPVSNTKDMEQTDEINLLYAKDYKVSTDLRIVIKHFSDLGKK